MNTKLLPVHGHINRALECALEIDDLYIDGLLDALMDAQEEAVFAIRAEAQGLNHRPKVVKVDFNRKELK
jgi:hypothetical protein